MEENLWYWRLYVRRAASHQRGGDPRYPRRVYHMGQQAAGTVKISDSSGHIDSEDPTLLKVCSAWNPCLLRQGFLFTPTHRRLI